MLQSLGMTHQQADEFLGHSKRSGQTRAADGPPPTLAMLREFSAMQDRSESEESGQ
jgi:hypothetical protein